MVFSGAALPAAHCCCLKVGPLGPADGAAERAELGGGAAGAIYVGLHERSQPVLGCGVTWSITSRPDCKSKTSPAGTRTRVFRVRAEYPDQLDYRGWICGVSVIKYHFHFIIYFACNQSTTSNPACHYRHRVKVCVTLRRSSVPPLPVSGARRPRAGR